MRFTKTYLVRFAIILGLVLVAGCTSENPYSHTERQPLSELMPDHWQKDQDKMDFWRTRFGHD